MENKSFFSVIMPVYGVEKYLSQAIDSVLCQTFSDFELILVDDKSPDNSPLICDEYEKKDSRVRVIHKPQNQGLGMARNTGLEYAAGEYVLFMDSDDTIHRDTLKIVSDNLKNKPQILVFGIKRFYQNKNGKTTRTKEYGCDFIEGCTVNDSGKIFLKLNDAHLFPFAWNKVYKRELITDNNASFEKTKLIEDFLFNIFIFSKAEKITVIPNCLYNYRKPAHQTLVNTYCPEFYDLAKRKFNLEDEFLKTTGNDTFEARQAIICSHIKHIISVFIRNTSKQANLSVKKQKQLIRDILEDETTVSALNEFSPESTVFRIISFIFRKKMINTCYLLIAIASKIKE